MKLKLPNTENNKTVRQRKPMLLLTLMFFIFSFSFSTAATWYSKNIVNVDLLSSWTFNADGSGGNPINFITAGDLFIIQAAFTNTTNANWTLGANVNLQIDGILVIGIGNASIGGSLTTSGPGAILNINTNGTFSVGGNTINNGSITDNNNTAATTFTGNFINGPTGNFSSTTITTIGNMIFNGGIIQNNVTAGSFTTGTINVNIASAWSGAGPMDIASTLTVTGGAVVLTNTNTGGVSVAGVLSGTGKFTQGTNGVLRIGNTLVPSITTTDFSTNCPNTVEYNFPGVQAIKGATYCNLTISGGGNKTPNASVIVNSTLTLNSGVIVLGANIFTFGANATVGGTPSGTNMIQCNSTGTVFKNYDFGGSFTFPVGTATDYSPATINITAATFIGGLGSRNVALRPVAAKAPAQIDATNSLGRYWAVTTTNLSGINATMNYTYVATDAVIGQEVNYVGAYYNTLPYWDVSGMVASPVISFTYTGLSSLNGNYTAGLQNAFVQTYYSIASTGWETNGTWSTTGFGSPSCFCTPVNGGIVIIGNGLTVTKSISTALNISSLQIDAGSILDMGTQTGLTISTFKSSGAGGNGTIRLSAIAAGTVTFPTVTTNNFNNSLDGTVEYNTANTYSLPLTITVYPNLTISGGASTKTVNAGTANLAINGNLTIATGVTLSNSVTNFTVYGTSSLIGSYTDASNTGITTFTGLVTKTGGTFTSTAVTIAANMVFNGGFTNTSGVFLGGAATIGTNKSITPTFAMSFAGTGGIVSSGTLTIGAGAGVTVSGGPLTAVNVDLNTATSILTLSNGNSIISGTLNTVAGSQLTVSTTGTFNVTGTFTNAGTFTDNDNTVTTSFSGLITNTGFFVTTNVTTAANMVFNSGFTNTSGTFTVPTATATGTLTPTTAMNFTGVGGLVGTGTLTIGAGTGVNVSGGALVAVNLNLNTATSNLILQSGNSTISGTLTTAASAALLVNTTGSFSVTGTTTNNGIFTDNNNIAATTFNGGVTNGVTGMFTSTIVNTAGRMIFNGGITQNNVTAGSFSAGTIDVNTASAWSGAGPINIASTLSVNGGAVNLTNTNTGGVSVIGVLSGTGIFTQGINGVLKLGNALVPSISTVNFGTNCLNTVEYNFAGAQAIKGTTYCILTISGGGNKTPDGTINTSTLNLNNGILTTGAFVVSITSAAIGAITGFSSSSYITSTTGGLERKMLANIGADGTNYIYPVGDGVNYRPIEIINIRTGAITPVIRVTETGAGGGSTDGSTMCASLLNSGRNWYASVVSGNFTSAAIRITENGLGIENVIGKCATQNGVYINSGGNNIASTITSNVGITLPNYFALGKGFPGAAGSITGMSSACLGANGVSYSITALAQATSYSWSYSGTGATINGSGNAVTIDFAPGATPGNLTAQGVNSCGNGTGSPGFAISLGSAVPATYTVTNTADAGASSLRQAIIDANANCGHDIINFNLGAGGPFTITLATPLPDLTDNDGVTIDGFSQAGASANTIPVFNATTGTPMNPVYQIILANGGAVAKGLSLKSNNNNIQGLVLQDFGDGTPSANDIAITITGNNNQVIGCNIGMDAGGTTRGTKTAVGIQISGANNVIGNGTAAGANLISGMNGSTFIGFGIKITDLTSTGNTVRGNIVGLQKDGSTLVTGSGQESGIYITSSATNNIIGGSNAGEGNVISGNGSYGLVFISRAANNTALGNIIGPQANGLSYISGNTQYKGIAINDAQNNIIGGNTAGARNIISGNETYGIWIYGDGVGSSGNVIKGNYIGIDKNGTSFITGSTQDYGVYMNGLHGGGNTIGGSGEGEGNVISGNKDATNSGRGIYLGSPVVAGNSVFGNIIGPQANGLNPVASNAQVNGIYISNSPNNTIGGAGVGAANTISYHLLEGVVVTGAAATGNLISRNSFFCNSQSSGNAGILLSVNGNSSEGAPVIVTVNPTTVTGTSPANADIEVFLKDNICKKNEGKTYSVTTTATGAGTWTANGSFCGEVIATATNGNNTSMFSNALSTPNGGIGTWTWTGNSINWFDPCNWDNLCLPDALSDVIIPGGTPNNPKITGATGSCKTINIVKSNGGHLTIDYSGSGHLTVAQ